MEQSPNSTPTNDPPQPKWQPLPPTDRRVAGVLAEKAKTTPDIYPMSLNAICTGCNQKSNRHPLMQLDPADVEESLDRLREMGAVGIVEGYGRVPKYRHYLYEWLGVNKVELAVITELLLRGAQTAGELRGRAARMEPIADLAALRPILEGLREKGLVVYLTPEGRGQVVTHALLPPREMEKVAAEYSGPAVGRGTAVPARSGTAPGRLDEGPDAPPVGTEPAGALRREIDVLRAEVGQLRSDLEELREELHVAVEGLERLRTALGE